MTVCRAAYKIHLANLRVAKKIRKETDVLKIPEKEGAIMIGLLTHDENSIIRGVEERRKPLL